MQTPLELGPSQLPCSKPSGPTPPGDTCTCRHSSKQQSWARKESPRALKCSTSVALCCPAAHIIHRAERYPPHLRPGFLCPAVIPALRMPMFAQQKAYPRGRAVSGVETTGSWSSEGIWFVWNCSPQATLGQERRGRLSLSHNDSREDKPMLDPWCQQEGRVRSLDTGYQVYRPQNSAPTVQLLQEQRLWELSLHAITLGSEQSRLSPYPRPMSPAKWTLWQLGRRGKGGLCRQEGKLTGWARGPWESLVLL